MIISHSKKFICLNHLKTGSRIRKAVFEPYSDFDVLKSKNKKLPEPKGNYRHFNCQLTKEYLEKDNFDIADYLSDRTCRKKEAETINLKGYNFNHEQK